MAQIQVCTAMPTPQHLGAADADHLWDCTDLKVRFLDGSAALQARVMDAALEWTEHCAITFEVTERRDADIRVTFSGWGAWSYVGTLARDVPARQPTMCLGWLDDSTPDDEPRRVALHEFGHALSLAHEHQHPRARIPWNRGVVMAYYRGLGWSESMVQRNVFDALPPGKVLATAGYDPLSIMLYSIPREFVRDESFVVGWNGRLSEGDKAFINALYNAPLRCEGER